MNPLLVVVPIIGAAALIEASSASASSPPIDHSGQSEDGPVIDYSPDMSENVMAFLSLIREGESANNYRAIVGGGVFSDYSHHPGWTSASMTKLSDWAGWNNSHAAGAYQFQPGTFKEMSDALELNGEFDPDSQDIAALGLLHRRGAYDDIVNGDIQTAVEKLRKEWDFFNKWDYSRVVAYFQSNGGNLA